MSIPELFVSHWQPVWSLNVLAVLVGGWYLRAAAGVRSGWPARRTVAFLAGLATLLVATESGIDSFDDRLLSAHMVQHLLLLDVAPVLLLCGQPLLLALRTFARPARWRLARALAVVRPATAPVVCLAVYYAVVFGTHVPAVFDATLGDPALHAAEHGLYLAAGLFVFMPLHDADPAPARRLGGLGRLVYALIAMVPMDVIGAYLNRDPTVAYAPYSHAAQALGISAVADQQVAGAIMWVGGSMVMVLVGLSASLSAMVGEERRQRAREAREARVPA